MGTIIVVANHLKWHYLKMVQRRFYAPCQSKEMIEVNLQTWESSTYAQTLSSFIDTYSQDGDYYYVGNIWTGGLFLKPDGASIRSPLGFVDSTTIWMKQDNSVIQTISLPHETAVAVETVGDQSSILFARTDEQTYSAYPNSDYSVLIYNSSAGTSIRLAIFGGNKTQFSINFKGWFKGHYNLQ